MSYYNEHDPFAAQWLRHLIRDGLITPGDVDDRSITEVTPDDLRGYTQAHFFAGIGGWSYALRLAGWPDDRPVWTGSCPCQPFSAAGKGDGFNDSRHLWPTFARLIRECRPAVVYGEQVASPAGLAWFDHVAADLEGCGYAVGAADLPVACLEEGWHIRQRLWWVVHAEHGTTKRQGPEVAGASGSLSSDTQERQRVWADVGNGGDTDGMADARGERCDGERLRLQSGQSRGARAEIGRGGEVDGVGQSSRPAETGVVEWLWCRDGVYRPTQPKYAKMAHGLSGRMVSVRHSGQIDAQEEEINGQAEISRPDQTLRVVSDAPCAKEISIRPGRPSGIPQTSVLRSRLHVEVDGRTNQEPDTTEQPQAIEQNSKCGMQGLPSDAHQAVCSSSGREPDEQSGREPLDGLWLMPSSLALAQLHGDTATEEAVRAVLAACAEEGLVLDAQYAPQEVWRSLSQESQSRLRMALAASGLMRTYEPPMVHGAINRVGRLRGYGNAIHPAVAALFIESTL